MNSIKRTKGIGKIIRVITFRKPVQKYVVAGDRACVSIVREARSMQTREPSDKAILAWARYDLSREIISGFWEIRTA